MKLNNTENKDPYFQLRPKRNYGFVCKFNSLVDLGYGSRQRNTRAQQSNYEDHRKEGMLSVSDGIQSDYNKLAFINCSDVSHTNCNRPPLCKEYFDLDKPEEDPPLKKCTVTREARNIWESQLVAEIRNSSVNGERVKLDTQLKKVDDHCIWTQTNEGTRDSELLQQKRSTTNSLVPEYLVADRNAHEPVDILSPTTVKTKRNRYHPYSHHDINEHNFYNRLGIKCFMPNSRKTNMTVFSGSYEELPPLPRLPSFSVGTLLKRCNSDIDVYQSIAHDSPGPPWISIQRPHANTDAQYGCDKPSSVRYALEHERLTDRDNHASCVENVTGSQITKLERSKLKRRKKRRNIRKKAHKDTHRVRFRLVKGSSLNTRIQTKWLNCKYCGDSFRIAGDLRSHMKKTHPYRCSRCPVCFPNKKELVAHSQSHLRYHCSLCMKKYVHHCIYKRHLRSSQHLNLSRIQKETAKMMYNSCLQAVQKGGLLTLSEDLMKIMESSWKGSNDDGRAKADNAKAVNDDGNSKTEDAKAVSDDGNAKTEDAKAASDDKLDSSLDLLVHTSSVCGTSTTTGADATRDEEPSSTSLEPLSPGWIVSCTNMVNGPLDYGHTDKVSNAFDWGSKLLNEWESSVCTENKTGTCSCSNDTEQNQVAPNEGYDLTWCDGGNLSYDLSSSQITNVENTAVTNKSNVINSNGVSSLKNEHLIIGNASTDQMAFDPVLLTTLTVANDFESNHYARPIEYNGDCNTTVNLTCNAGGCYVENIVPPSHRTRNRDLGPVDVGVYSGSSTMDGSSDVGDTVTLRNELDVLFQEIEQEVKNSSLFSEQR